MATNKSTSDPRGSSDNNDSFEISDGVSDWHIKQYGGSVITQRRNAAVQGRPGDL